MTVIKFEIATDGKMSIPKNMIESAEIMGNYTSYYNVCATAVMIYDGKITKNENCVHSDQAFLDKLTRHVSIHGKPFILSIAPLYEIPSEKPDDFGLNYFLKAEKSFEQLIKTIPS